MSKRVSNKRGKSRKTPARSKRKLSVAEKNKLAKANG